MLARALDAWWEELSAPDPFVVVEAAAGVGALAKAVLASSPACAPALRYLLVERSSRLRDRQPAVLPIEPAATVLGPMAPSDEDDFDGPRSLPRGGPRVTSLGELPAGSFIGVVIANELLDNLPWSLLERGVTGWSEVRVGEADDGPDPFVEVLTPASAADVQSADRLVPNAAPGARIPVQAQATDWLRGALRLLRQGRVVVFDYASTTADLAARPQHEWMRTYRGGRRGSDPLDRPGSQDLTVEVCVDQLARVQPPTLDRSQADFLTAHGIDALVNDARAAWQAAAARPDIEALKARSRVDEAAALVDPMGLGAFRVLEWVVG